MGNPKKMITAQKAAITRSRVWMASEVSGGGTRALDLGIELAEAFGDAWSPFVLVMLGTCFAP